MERSPKELLVPKVKVQAPQFHGTGACYTLVTDHILTGLSHISATSRQTPTS